MFKIHSIDELDMMIDSLIDAYMKNFDESYSYISEENVPFLEKFLKSAARMKLETFKIQKGATFFYNYSCYHNVPVVVENIVIDDMDGGCKIIVSDLTDKYHNIYLSIDEAMNRLCVNLSNIKDPDYIVSLHDLVFLNLKINGIFNTLISL